MTQPQRLDFPSEPAPSRVDPGVQRTMRVLDRVFGTPAERGFDIRLWDGSVYPGLAAPRADFSLGIARRGAMRRMLLPPSELSIAESFISGDVEIDGTLESAMTLGDAIGARLAAPGSIARLVSSVLALPIDDEAPGDLRRHSRRLRLLTPRARKSAAPELQFHHDVGHDFYALWM